MRSEPDRTSLFSEAQRALLGVARLAAGRADAVTFFDMSQRGLAGSFIPLVLAHVLLVVFIGFGAATGNGVASPATQLFIAGSLVGARYGTMRVLLPAISALHGFRPYMVAANWAMAYALTGILTATMVIAFLAALLLGPGAADTIVAVILTLWAAVAIGVLVVEISIQRLIVGLKTGEIALAIAGQILALLIAIAVLAQLPLT